MNQNFVTQEQLKTKLKTTVDIFFDLNYFCKHNQSNIVPMLTNCKNKKIPQKYLLKTLCTKKVYNA